MGIIFGTIAGLLMSFLLLLLVLLCEKVQSFNARFPVLVKWWQKVYCHLEVLQGLPPYLLCQRGILLCTLYHPWTHRPLDNVSL